MESLLKKRRLEGDLDPWRDSMTKRVCVRATDGPMETSWSVTSSQQQQTVFQHSNTSRRSQIDSSTVDVVQAAPHCCPRCLGGEPGHINHILGH
ncbi:uncharacterized protein ACJ7VT_004841 [Polymixia lowei]